MTSDVLQRSPTHNRRRIDTRNEALTFCTSPPLLFNSPKPFLSNSCTFITPLRWSTPRPHDKPCQLPAPPCMALVNELLVKGLEVGVATFLGNAVAMQQARKPVEQKRSFFGLRKKPVEPEPTPSFDAAKVVTELMRLVEGLPDLVEKGGPEGKKWVKLAICVAIDLVGSGSLGVPFLGDALDLVTAPLSAVMLQALFGSTLITMGGLAEEILPGTDGIPTATLAWLAEEHGYLKIGQEQTAEKKKVRK